MNLKYKEVEKIFDVYLFPLVQELYGLDGYTPKFIDRGYEIYEGQNAVYCCKKEGENPKILRLSLSGRTRAELLAEVEYIRYLFENGGSISNVISSRNGNLLEEITHNNITCLVSLFEKAKGMQLHENSYRYREGEPISEYYYNIGKTIGKLHQLSKKYTPVHRRYSFFDKYNSEYINELIPDSFSLLKSNLNGNLNTLEELGCGRELYGMVHFDYNDSNYSIDFETGRITVYDFDSSCFGWYMYDLAYTWMYGAGWASREKDSTVRKSIMDNFLKAIVEGYRSETRLEDCLLEKFPFFINTVITVLITEAFEHIRSKGEEPEYDFGLSYFIKCIEYDIPYMGFFHDIYSCETPFEHGDERINLFISTLNKP